jgi:hypothetical protein
MDQLLKELVDISFDIYTSLGQGYNEVVYHKAFEVALRLSSIRYESEVITPILYKGHNVGFGKVDIKLENFIIEFKAINNLTLDSVTQTKNYMKTWNISHGLLINFGQKNNSLDIRYLYGESIYHFINGEFTSSLKD